MNEGAYLLKCRMIVIQKQKNYTEEKKRKVYNQSIKKTFTPQIERKKKEKKLNRYFQTRNEIETYMKWIEKSKCAVPPFDS